MKRVIIESPYAASPNGTIEENVHYARLCVRHSVLRGEAPIASHLLFTQPNILDDSVPSERTLGIEAGLAWLPVADFSAFYTDRGWSRGMLAAFHLCIENAFPFRFRALEGGPTLPPFPEQYEDWLLSKIDSN